MSLVELLLTLLCGVAGLVFVWPLLHWAVQWLALWISAVGTGLAVYSAGPAHNRIAWVGLAVLSLCLLVTLPELSDMSATGKPARLGLVNHVRIKLERAAPGG